MTMLRWHSVLVPLLISAVTVVGCAKRPATTQASAPAPLGAAGAGMSGVQDTGDGAGGAGAATGEDAAGRGQTGGGDQTAMQGRDGSGPGDGSNGAGGRGGAGGDAARGADGAGAGATGPGGAGQAGDAGTSGAGGAAGDSAGAGGRDASGRDGAGRDGAGGAAGDGRAVGGAGQDGAGGAGGTTDGQGAPGGGVVAAVPAVPGGADGGPSGAGESDPIAGQATAAARPEVREFATVQDLHDIHFDFDRYDIKPEAARLLDANAEWLKANPNHELLIEGHCDERGTNEYNLALGEHRAKSAMNYLISQGVQSNRMTIISYGEERPSCGDKEEGCWAKNRRAHFLVKSR